MYCRTPDTVILSSCLLLTQVEISSGLWVRVMASSTAGEEQYLQTEDRHSNLHTFHDTSPSHLMFPFPGCRMAVMQTNVKCITKSYAVNVYLQEPIKVETGTLQHN